MSRYFYDIVSENLVLRDHRGVDLSSPEQARNEALRRLSGAAVPLPKTSKRAGVVLEVRDVNNALLARATKGGRIDGPAATPPAIERAAEISEQAFANDIAKWVIAQREQVQQLGKVGQDIAMLEHILASLSNLIAERLAERIRSAITR